MRGAGRRIVSAVFLVFGSSGPNTPAIASGGHWEVDDATLAEPGRCQIEAFYRRGGSSDQELVAEPACNPTGNLELLLSVSRFRDDAGWDTAVGVEAKTLFRTPVDGGWGWGLVARSDWRDTVGQHESAELYVPVTVIVNDHVRLHANGGAAYLREESDALTWGLAADLAVAFDLNLILEAHGTHRGETEFQAGFRHAIGRGHIDLGYGWREADSGDNWVSVGFAWMF